MIGLLASRLSMRGLFTTAEYTTSINEPIFIGGIIHLPYCTVSS
jgi:hypothetical protein